MSNVAIVTGGAGFVAATLVERLLAEGKRVVALDNFCRGARKNLGAALDHPAFSLIEVELSDGAATLAAFRQASPGGPAAEVWHLAANSDIPAGVADPNVDLRDTFLTTFHVLLAMRETGAKTLLFSSTSAIYGDFGERPITEDIGPLFPISNYGAMKLASEGQITAAVESFLDRAVIFRFPNVVGVPATHGVLLDFVRKLKADPSVLPVLGDGTQRKSYLHVSDLVAAMLLLRDRQEARRDVWNIGPVDDGITVREIAEETAAAASPGARIAFGTGNRGWVGDVPKFRYSTAKLAALGWKPSLASRGAIRRAVAEIVAQERE